MSAYLPGLADGRALFGIAIAATAMVWGGRLLAGRRVAPEVALLCGWGALCLVLTLWAACLPFTLYAPMAACFLAALPGCRTQGQVEGGIWRVALLTLPLWLVMAEAQPSQVDTWLNLLPNQAYLIDHGALPHDGGPPHHSFLPAAPYDTQFAAFAASLVSGGLAPNALALFNMLLLCAAGLKLARVVAGRDGVDDPLPLPWWAVAAGLLLVAPLNAGFVPRVFFSAYGEAPLAVASLFAVSLSADLLLAERRGAATLGTVVSLSLVLAAAIDVKQSAPGLLVPLGACLLAMGLACPGLRRGRWCALVAAAYAPALLLYGAWRWFVQHSLPAGELKLLPASEWHWALLPDILLAMGQTVLAKPAYFAMLAALLAGAALAARQWSRVAVVLGLGAGMAVLFNAFLLFTYMAHFPANWAAAAHSFFRYDSQLSLVAMLGLASWAREPASTFLSRRPQLCRYLAGVSVTAVLVLPVALLPLLRFDLAVPQPTLRTMARETAPLLYDDDRLALVLPGDVDDAAGSMLRGLLLFAAPRHPDLAFRAELEATPAALDDAASFGARWALVTCSSKDGLAGLPPDVAGLLERRDGRWRAVAAWPYAAGFLHARFSAMMPRAPFCGVDAP